MPFAKGHQLSKGNKGKKEGAVSWSGLFKEELDKVGKDSRQSARVQVVRRLVALAVQGEQWAMRELLDRCMGKAVAQVDVTSNGQSLNASISFEPSRVIDITPDNNEPQDAAKIT